jgi:hypothetical protein
MCSIMCACVGEKNFERFCMLSLGDYTKSFFEISYLVSGLMFLNLSGNVEHLTCPFNSRESLPKIT